MTTFINPDAIQDNSITAEKLSDEVFDNTLPATLDYGEYTFTEKVTPEVKNDSATIRSIKGNTVVWNKIGGLQNGSLGYHTNNPSVFDNSISTTLIAGHEYLIISDIDEGSIVRIFGKIGDASIQVAVIKNTATFFKSEYNLVAQTNVNNRPEGSMWAYYATNDDRLVTQFDIHDLTQMFGVGNEPTTAEEFYARKPIGIDESAYNEGEIISCTADILEVRGVNMVDPQLLVNGNISSSGVIQDNSTFQNILLDVKPNTTYYIYHCASGNDARRGAFYTKDGSFISIVGGVVETGQYYQNARVTTPSNCYKMRIVRDVRQSEPLSVYLSEATLDGKSFPYFNSIINLADVKIIFNTNGLHGMDGFHDTIFFEKGSFKGVKHFGVVKMNELNVIYRSSTNVFVATRNNIGAKPAARARCTGYNYVSKSQSQLSDGEFTTSDEYYGFQFKDSGLGDNIDAFRAKIADMYMVYELSAPEEYDINLPELLSIKAEKGGVERIIAQNASTPVTAEIAYNYDARSNIESLKQSVENKADKATTLKGYGIVDDYYTDAEVDILLEEVREDMAKEYLPLNKIQTVSLLTASGNITKDAYNAMATADIVKVLYGGSTNNPQYELTMSAKERVNGSIAYSAIFFSAKESVFKSFSVVFAAPSSSVNAVSYQVTLANLAIGAATVSE